MAKVTAATSVKENKLLAKLLESSTIKTTSVLSESKFFTDVECVSTSVPILNLALSGSLRGGYGSAITMIAGPSKHFKTATGLVAMKAYLDKYPTAIVLYYDTEFGAPPAYLKSAGIDVDRVVHTPILHIEELKFDMSAQLDNIQRGDKVFIFIDSIGNIASKKEVQDALDGNSAADLSRSKQLKSFFRIVTPQVTIKDLPLFVINHTYASQDGSHANVVSGGTGGVYSSNSVLVVGKQQDKDDEGLKGFRFVYNAEKSRRVVEKSKFIVEVSFENGVSRFSGLLDLALESGHVVKPSNGWYSRRLTNPKTGECLQEPKKWRKADTDDESFWTPVLKDETFHKAVEDKYKVSTGDLVNTDHLDMESDENDSDLSLPETE